MKGRMKKILCICCLMGVVASVLIPYFADATNKKTPLARGIMPGDVYQDGKIDGKDISLLLQYRLKKKELNTEQFVAGDVYTDGKIDGKDVSMLSQFRLGKINSLGSISPTPGNTADPGGEEDKQGKYKISGTVKTKSGTQLKRYRLKFVLKKEYDGDGLWTQHEASVNVNNGIYEVYLDPGEYVISNFDGYDDGYNNYEDFEDGVVEVKDSNQTRDFVFDGYYFSGTLRRGGGAAVEEEFACEMWDDFTGIRTFINVPSDENGFFSFVLPMSLIIEYDWTDRIKLLVCDQDLSTVPAYTYEFAFNDSDRINLELTNELYKVTGKVMNHNGGWDLDRDFRLCPYPYPYYPSEEGGFYYDYDVLRYDGMKCLEYNQETGMIEYECYVPAGTYRLGIQGGGSESETIFTVNDEDLKDVDINFNVFKYECRLQQDGSSGYVQSKNYGEDYARIIDSNNHAYVDKIYDGGGSGYLNSGRYDVEICVYKEGNADETEWKSIGTFYVDKNNSTTTIKY